MTDDERQHRRDAVRYLLVRYPFLMHPGDVTDRMLDDLIAAAAPGQKRAVTGAHLWALQPALGKRVENVILTDLRRGFLRIVFDDGTTLDITAYGDCGSDAELGVELGTVEPVPTSWPKPQCAEPPRRERATGPAHRVDKVPAAESEAFVRELNERFVGLIEGDVTTAHIQGYARSRGYHLVNPHYRWSELSDPDGKTVRLRTLYVDGLERVR